MASEKHILVYIARHGTTTLNQDGKFRGPIDAPLDAQGWKDANRVAFFLAPVELAAIFYSNRKRTRDTAKTIAKDHPDVELVEHSDLRALDVGDLGGQPKNKENLEIVKEHTLHPEQTFPGGESLNDFRRRVQPLISGAVDLALANGVPVLLVTHSSIVREVGMMVHDDHEHTLVEPGGVAAIYVQDGKLSAEPIFKPRLRRASDGPEIIT